MLLDHTFCNKISDLTIEKFGTQGYKAISATVQHIWQHTSDDSGLRRLHVDMFASSVSRDVLRDSAVNSALDLVIKLAEIGLFFGNQHLRRPASFDGCK